MTKIVLSSLILAAAAAACQMDPQAAAPEDEEQLSQKLVVPGSSVGRGAPGAYWTFQGDSLQTYTGTDGRINVVNTGTFGITTLNEYSIAGSTILPFGGRIYLTWFGTDYNLNIMSSTNGGSTWGSKVVYNVKGTGYRPNAEPTLVEYGGRLNLFYALVPSSANPDSLQWDAVGSIHQFILWDNGWAYGSGFAAQTRSGPSAAVLGNGQLVVAWTNRDFGHFRTKKFTPGQGWGADNYIVRAQEGHLKAGMDGSVLWLSRNSSIWNPDRIELSRSYDGANFTTIVTTAHTSSSRPTLAGPYGTVFVWSHVGTDPNRTLNWTAEALP